MSIMIQHNVHVHVLSIPIAFFWNARPAQAFTHSKECLSIKAGFKLEYKACSDFLNVVHADQNYDLVGRKHEVVT